MSRRSLFFCNAELRFFGTKLALRGSEGVHGTHDRQACCRAALWRHSGKGRAIPDRMPVGHPAAKSGRVMVEDTLDTRLLRAEVLVGKADRRVVDQRRLLARLERNGEDSSAARAQLAEFEEKRSKYLAERDRLALELRK